MLGFLVAALVVAAAAAWTDWRTGLIPNWLSIGALGCAPIAHAIYSLVAGGFTVQEALLNACYSVLGAVACGLLPLLLYNKNAIGGGDVKLFVAIGALCRPLLGVEAEIYGFFAAAIVAPVRLAYEGKLFRTVSNAFFLTFNPLLPKARRREVMPEGMSWFRLGPAIFLGTLFTLYLHWAEAYPK